MTAADKTTKAKYFPTWVIGFEQSDGSISLTAIVAYLRKDVIKQMEETHGKPWKEIRKALPEVRALKLTGVTVELKKARKP